MSYRLAAVLVLAVTAQAQLNPAKAIYGTPAQRKERNQALRTITPPDIKRHLVYLASDARGGRESGADGADQAAHYLAAQLRRLGLIPLGDEGGYFQRFNGPAAPGKPEGRGALADANWLDLQDKADKPAGTALVYDKDYRPLASSGVGSVSAGVAFVGYGIADPGRGWDDYAGIDVAGKLVLVLAGLPALPADPPFTDGEVAGSLARKLALAQEKGAAAFALCDLATKTLPAGEDSWPPTRVPTGIPAIQLTPAAADKLAALIKIKLPARAAEIAAAGAPRSAPAAGSDSDAEWKPRARLTVSAAGPLTGGFKNVIGLIEGSDPALKHEVLVVGGHYDHVGTGQFGSRGGQGQIHNGADDNASGTSGVLEIAEAIQLECRLKRSVLVILFDAEERGLLGSKHYCEQPRWPLDKTVAMFNLDMISRNGFKEIFIGAADRNATIHQLLLEINKQYQITLKFDGMEPFTNRSDQFHFLEKGIPGIFFFGGLHNDYHTAGDDPEKCNLDKAQAISQLVFYLVYTVGNLPERP